MSKNRHQRRAEATDLPPLPTIPNISGTKEACENCRFSRDKTWRAIMHLHRQPAPPEDEVACLLECGGGKTMKRWGWCSHWAPVLNG